MWPVAPSWAHAVGFPGLHFRLRSEPRAAISPGCGHVGVSPIHPASCRACHPSPPFKSQQPGYCLSGPQSHSWACLPLAPAHACAEMPLAPHLIPGVLLAEAWSHLCPDFPRSTALISLTARLLQLTGVSTSSSSNVPGQTESRSLGALPVTSAGFAHSRGRRGLGQLTRLSRVPA